MEGGDKVGTSTREEENKRQKRDGLEISPSLDLEKFLTDLIGT